MASFDGLMGADCAGDNAMLKFAAHVGGDRSLQRDVAGDQDTFRTDTGPVRFGQARNDAVPSLAARDGVRQIADKFRAQAQAGPAGPASAFAPAFKRAPPPQEAAWAREFESMSFQQAGPAGPARFDDLEQFYRMQPPAAAQGAQWGDEFASGRANIPAPALQPHEFAEFERHYQAPVTTARISELSEEQWADEFAGKQPVQAVGKGKEAAASWAEEYAETADDLSRAHDMFRDLDSDLADAWATATRGGGPSADDEWLNPESFAFADKRIEEKEYEFEPENPFLTTADPFAEGMRLVNSGNLSDAALAFEAAVRQDEHLVQGWIQLGMCQAENEKEAAAISALQRAVREDPLAADASLALAISYTNESAETQAFDALERWIRVTHPNLPPSAPYVDAKDREASHAFRGTSHRKVAAGSASAVRSLRAGRVAKQDRQAHLVSLYLEAVRTAGEVNPDVQVGLGVLFNISCEYDKAVDCFRTALQVRPQDYLLWNRLGATLANSGHSEDAISAYHEALALKPSFVRARYNLGVSCINIGCLKEAAEHLLGALALHGGGQQRNVSLNLWETLRRTFIMMQRPDLVELSHKHDVESFRPHFEF